MLIPFELWRKWFYFRWNLLHMFSSCKRDWVKISKKEKKAFVNITIYPSDESCKVYDPRKMINSFLMHFEKDPTTFASVSGFCNQDGLVSVRTNCSLVHNDI